MRLNVLIALGLTMLLVGCGSLGRLETKAGGPPGAIRDYDRVIVADFAANDTRPAKDDAEQAERAAQIELGRKAFSAKLAEEIRATGAFSEVAQAKLLAPALQVTGTVDLWEPGNVAARMLTGFAGKSEFSATVVVSDLETGRELARQVVDRNSWPLPIGASTNLVQTVDYFMHQAARRVAEELAKAKQAPPEAK
ncbi:MAG: hypothetical protein DCF27_11225 [Lysobacteraceae bacterium]|nr:MAG: hypothetical protein DCF27_11225 [Xanthomonadaceae bacterium]